MAIDTGGYDTHADQAARHPLLLRDISDSLAAFHTDMGEDMNNVAVVVMTEFGRTADVNGSDGTDHGWASAWWVISKGITGGFFGGWPGLDTDNIGSTGRRFMLNYVTDYRQILADLMVSFMPGNVANAEAAFPGFTYGAPLGFSFRSAKFALRRSSIHAIASGLASSRSWNGPVNLLDR